MLATYFVFVDMTLLVQFFYYRQKSKLAATLHRRPSRLRAGSTTTRHMSTDRLTPRYRTLSAVAANVAAAAAFAAQQNEQGEPRYSQARWTTGTQHHEAPGSHVSAESIGDDADIDVAAMTESVHSDRSNGQRRISWSTERYANRGGSSSRTPVISRSTFLPALQITTTDSPIDTLVRGRPLQRETGENVGEEAEVTESPRTGSIGASRRGAGMVFLAAWALFSIGALNGNIIDGLAGSRTDMGEVLSARAPSMSTPSLPVIIPEVLTIPTTTSLHSRFLDSDGPSHDLPPDDTPLTYPSTERILGRIFAWLCTTLYLTSRLPQIWKNVSIYSSSYRHYVS
jgi:hypothetical protein